MRPFISYMVMALSFIGAAYYGLKIVVAWKAKLKPAEQIVYAVGSIIFLFGFFFQFTPKWWTYYYASSLMLIGVFFNLTPKAWSWVTGLEFFSVKRRDSKLKPNHASDA